MGRSVDRPVAALVACAYALPATLHQHRAPDALRYSEKPMEMSIIPDCVPPDTARSGGGGGALPRGS